MKQPGAPRGPDGPRVPASDPVRERQMLSATLETIADESSRRIIGLPNIRDFLINFGLDIDEDGFIIREDTEEYAIPYAYDPDLFRSIESPVDNPFDSYFQPESKNDRLIISYDKIHLSGLHSVVESDGKARPIRDNSLILSLQLRELTLAFTTVTQWSSFLQKVKEMEDTSETPPDLYINHDGIAEHDVEIGCLHCEFTAPPMEWVGEEDNPVCPECDVPWATSGLVQCEECRETHHWTALQFGESFHSKPRCPTCDASVQGVDRKTRYSGFE